MNLTFNWVSSILIITLIHSKQQSKQFLFCLESTHIRILAFSPSGILNCSVEINNVYLGQCQKATDYLFVLKWDPKSYKDEIHTIAVTVFDQSGRMNKVSNTLTFC